ncbi:hypothetical protein MTYP_00670 [Methylophilaceae bacterium]|nr:hypothetical protein MTYP_00670 [Methylophilaceae bacterium]
MPYVMRNTDGAICAVSTEPQEGWEWVAQNEKEYIQFLEVRLPGHDPFRESDIQLARVLEDLINVLIDQDVIRFTDLPEAARKRLLERQSMRQKNQQGYILDETSEKLI